MTLGKISCGVPQGSVLDPLLNIMHTTHLSTLISSLSFDHHLYADDTQLLFSFHPLNFDSSITFKTATGQLGTRPTRHMWRVDLLILHSVWRVDHTGVTSWLLVGRVLGYS